MDDSTGARAAIDRLVDARRRHEAARDALREASQQRDAEVARASAQGLSRRRVAQAAGVSAGRVQQILDERTAGEVNGGRRRTAAAGQSTRRRS